MGKKMELYMETTIQGLGLEAFSLKCTRHAHNIDIETGVGQEFMRIMVYDLPLKLFCERFNRLELKLCNFRQNPSIHVRTKAIPTRTIPALASRNPTR